MNANVAADEFLKPSSVEIAARGIEFGEPVWPEPIKEYNQVLEFENLVFRGHFQVKIPVKAVEDGYDSLTTNATFHYQACDNSITRTISKARKGPHPSHCSCSSRS